MKLRITYEFDIRDIPSAGVVFIGDEDHYIGTGGSLQEAIDRVHDLLTMAGGFTSGEDFAFDIVDIRPEQDAELINREASVLSTMKALTRNRTSDDLRATEDLTYEERHAFDEHVEAEPVRTDKQIRDDVTLRAVITSHLAVEDWSQDGPEAFTCYLAVGHFFGRDTSFTVNSLERMLRILNSEAIDVVDNP